MSIINQSKFSFDEGKTWYNGTIAWKPVPEEQYDWLPSWDEMMKRNRDEIIAAFQIPPSMLGSITAQNGTNYQQELLRFLEQFRQESIDDTQKQE